MECLFWLLCHIMIMAPLKIAFGIWGATLNSPEPQLLYWLFISGSVEIILLATIFTQNRILGRSLFLIITILLGLSVLFIYIWFIYIIYILYETPIIFYETQTRKCAIGVEEASCLWIEYGIIVGFSSWLDYLISGIYILVRCVCFKSSGAMYYPVHTQEEADPDKSGNAIQSV